MIGAQATKLSRLIDQLLDVSRLKAGKLPIEREPTDLVPLVREVVARARTISGREAMAVQAPASFEANVDPLRIEQVLTNLVDNAVTYSPVGGPIDAAVTSHVTGVAEITVTDHGLGIPTEKRAHIFERFYQAHGAGQRSGLGLGLYISHQIVEQHRGDLYAEFPPEGGTRFVLRLPLCADT